MSYARGTKVPVIRSKGQVETFLAKAGADQFTSGWASGRAIIAFRLQNRLIRIEMPTPKGDSAREQAEERRRWRAMLLYVKAKMESVKTGIVSFEEAFMSHIVMPGGKTVGQLMIPRIQESYNNNQIPHFPEDHQ